MIVDVSNRMIINFSDRIIVNVSDRILVDIHVKQPEPFMEVCRALRLSTEPSCSFRLGATSVDVDSLGVARINVLLEQMPPDVRTRVLSVQGRTSQG